MPKEPAAENPEEHSLVTAAADEIVVVEAAPIDLLKVSNWSVATKHRVGSLLVLVVVSLYVGSGVMIQVLFDDMEFEKPFFFSFVSVGLCSLYLLSPFTTAAAAFLASQACVCWVQHQQATSVGSPLHLLRPAMRLRRHMASPHLLLLARPCIRVLHHDTLRLDGRMDAASRILLGEKLTVSS